MGAPKTERKFRRVIRIPETCKRTGLSKTTLWRKEKAGEFPPRVRLSERSTGHYEDEVDDWINNLERVDLAGQKVAANV
jgi:predicted DNA-binding transcriptional regulator AlpA